MFKWQRSCSVPAASEHGSGVGTAMACARNDTAGMTRQEDKI